MVSIRRLVGLVVAMALAAGIAACGGDDSTSTSTSAATAPAATQAPAETTAQDGAAADTGDRTQRAQDAAKAAVEKEGGPVDLPKGKTVAILDLVGTAESSTRMREAALRAGKAFGWKMLTYDSGGDADKAAANIQTALNQGAEALISVSITPALETQGLKQAAQKGIPVINISNAVEETPEIAASYTADYTQGVAMLTKEMAKQVPNGSQVGLFQTPLLFGYHDAVAAFKQSAKANDWDVVQDTEVDLADIQAGVQRGMNALLGSHPDVKGVFIDLSPGFPIAGQVLRSRDKCGSVLLYGDHDDKINMKTIRDGCGTALASYPIEATPLMAMDQIAEFFARDKQVADLPKDDAAIKAIYGINLLTPQVITKDNLPAGDTYPAPVEDVEGFFSTKWSDEFQVTLPAA